MSSRPTWAEVSLSALRHNFRTLQQHVSPGVTVCAVVKADAYGHGAVECAGALQAEGAKWLGVTSTDEAACLRAAGITARILLMTGFWRGEEEELVRLDLTPAVWERWHLDLLRKAAEKLRKAPYPVHLKVDTGMARLGLSLNELPSALALLKSSPALALEGLLTHLASAEVLDAPDLQAQLTNFERACEAVKAAGLTPLYYHAANSAAIASCPAAWKNMVRPGISLYGYYLPFERSSPPASQTTLELPVHPVLSWKTRIISLRRLPSAQAIGYNGTYVTRTPALIAVLPVGYADGLNRLLSSCGRVIVRGHYAPIVGSISMDITLVDVTAVPSAGIGDEVLILGRAQPLAITAWEHARLASTIPYETLCNISKRVPRRYLD